MIGYLVIVERKNRRLHCPREFFVSFTANQAIQNVTYGRFLQFLQNFPNVVEWSATSNTRNCYPNIPVMEYRTGPASGKTHVYFNSLSFHVALLREMDEIGWKFDKFEKEMNAGAVTEKRWNFHCDC